MQWFRHADIYCIRFAMIFSFNLMKINLIKTVAVQFQVLLAEDC